MGRTGALIAICGIDGSGKSTQTGILCEGLRRTGRQVHQVEFPRYEEGFFGELIARYLRGEFSQEAAAVNPYLAALPFACDRWQAAPALRRWAAEGAVVVCNRYVPANMAHQGGKIEPGAQQDAFLQWVQELEYGVFQLPRADLHVWLDMPPKTAVGLLANKGQRTYLRQGADIHESDLEHLSAAREVYRRLAEEPGWITVRAAAGSLPLSRQQVAQQVWEGVSSLIERRQ